MYNLVSRIQDGLGELKKLLETHIHNQGLAAIEKCGEAALNVSTVNWKSVWLHHFHTWATGLCRAPLFTSPGGSLERS